VQLITLAIFLICLFVASKGISIIKTVSTIVGASAFVMSFLYIFMVWAAPAITGSQLQPINFDIKNFFPTDPSVLLSLSVLIFAVGGTEKVAPYVNKLKKPGSQFPASMILAMAAVIFTAILGTLAMGMMYGNEIPNDFLVNGQYEAFQKLGAYYGLGNSLMIIFAITNALCHLSVLIISIDAPLRILLGNADKRFFPSAMFKTNKHGAYTRGMAIVGVIVSILILLPCIGIGDVNNLVKWLIKLNSICMPLRYLFIFVAYFALKVIVKKKFESEYHFIKNKWFGAIVGAWCFIVTTTCIVMGMVTDDPFMLIMNISTPIVLVGLGFIMPALASRERKKQLPPGH
ncbi:MAG: APC family permease, partial [Clostridia bacterium]|nr:APC family permease [Clostridia bacterium]